MARQQKGEQPSSVCSYLYIHSVVEDEGCAGLGGGKGALVGGEWR